MRDTIEIILRKYGTFRSTMQFAGDHEISQLFATLRSQIEELAAVRANPNLIVKSSYGKGNWAAVPWVAILDTRETSTTQDGTYVVLLFAEDGQHCQIKLAQGVTEVQKIFKRGAPEELQRRADQIRANLITDSLREFSQPSITSGLGKGNMAKLYESSTIFSKSYLAASLPDDDELESVINKLVDTYSHFVGEKIKNSESVDTSSKPLGRVWALAAGKNGQQWSDFLETGEVAIGWDELGDLSKYQSLEETFRALTNAEDHRPSNDALCCYQFAHEISIGDLIVAKAGRKKILGMGRVTSDYIWNSSLDSFKNRRKVDWLRTEETEFPGTGTTIKTLTEITSYPTFISLVRDYLGFDENAAEEDFDGAVTHEAYTPHSIINDGCFLDETTIMAMLGRLRVKKNIILQGPPGTGKTWLAKRLAYALVGHRNPERVKVVQFHANISYEDFIRGYRPTSDGKLSLVDGTFIEAIEDARNSSQPLVVVIEEVNRGNPAQIFGEMLTLLEADKRNSREALELTYKRKVGERVFIPPNLYVIGTMNIADRSLALVDLALRRRFAFIELAPTLNAAWRAWLQERCGFPADLIAKIEAKITALNDQIGSDQRLGQQFRIGHSYVTPPEEADINDPTQWFSQVISTEIAPLLHEYWFDDPEQADRAIKELNRGI
jgi:MoxR-like ATPase